MLRIRNSPPLNMLFKSFNSQQTYLAHSNLGADMLQGREHSEYELIVNKGFIG